MLNLSKSKYVKAVTYCPKALWLTKYKPEVESTEGHEKQINDGKKVGDLARDYFAGSVKVEFNRDNLQQMVIDTQRYLEEGKEYICEATFAADGLFCSVDILHYLGNNEVDIYEVKATGRVEYYHKDDISFQCYLLTKCGYNVKHAYLMHLNNKYIRKGKLDLKQLFTIEDLTDYVKEHYSDVEENIKYIREKADVQDEPEVAIHEKCDYKSNKCPFFDYCTGKYPRPNVFDIGFRFGFKKSLDLFNDGIVTFEDIYKNNSVPGKYMIRVNQTLYGKEPYINKENIRRFLDNVTYPLYYLDFETFQEPIPPYDGIWPYRQTPFQYSLHIQEKKGGELIHKEFLAKAGEDPRRAIAESLCRDIPDDVCVVAYWKTFECTRLKELAEEFSDLHDHLMKINENIVDLIVPFSNLDYYSKSMGGRSSIKVVLPTLFPDDPSLDYHSLDQIHHGAEAMVAFFDMVAMSTEEEERTRHNLLKYCELDTFAMVKLLDKLYEFAET